jgi:hypothetical protein
MNVRSLKLAGAAAGLLFLVGASSNVYAQTTVLNVNTTGAPVASNTVFISTFTFNQSLTLNSIGVPNRADSDGLTFGYKIGDSAEYTYITDTLGAVDNGFRYYTFASPQTYPTGTKLIITNSRILADLPIYYARTITSTNNVGVTHTSNKVGVARAAGNIKVSNPSNNVAPEPGSIALLLTGSGALAGIALRRRRNAALLATTCAGGRKQILRVRADRRVRPHRKE